MRLPLVFRMFLALAVIGIQAGAAVRITEFLAANDGFLRDEDGDSSDWIEIHNDSAASVNLLGWHLTDNSSNLSKWTFPEVHLPPRGYLLVFASGKDRRPVEGELHTNFRLSREGEFLALVEPDGATLAQAFAPAFPSQRANISFGLDLQSRTVPLVSPGASGTVFAPGDGALGHAWTMPGFSDAEWKAAVTGIGFDAGSQAEFFRGEPVLMLDFNHSNAREQESPQTQPGFGVMTLRGNPAVFNGITVSLSALGGAFLDDRQRSTPVNSPPDFNQALLYQDFIFANGQSDGNGMRIHLTGLRPEQEYELTLWSFDTGSAGNRISDWIETAGGEERAVISGYTFDGRLLPVEDEHHTFTARVRSSSSGELQLEGRRNGGTSHGVFLNAMKLVELGYGPLVQTGLEELMHNKTSSVYLRIPFQVEEPAEIARLRLKMNYLDGFAAYLNGQWIASANAPNELDWQSAAATSRSPGEALEREEFLIDNSPGLLVAGENVLAIQGLNSSEGSSQFLILPQLDGIASEGPVLRYFDPPTPGAENGPGYLSLVADPEFSLPRGFYDSPFSLALTTATPGAEIYWSANGSAPAPEHGTLYQGAIPISGTGAVRAIAVLEGHLPSEVITHTYIFLDQVLQQAGTQPGYPAVWQASYPADYGMDPEIVHHPRYGPGLKDDLRSIPTLSIITEHDALWHPSTGIYVDATRRGVAWERPASVELFHSDQSPGFQVNCGIRMQGNASRDNVRTAKHSIRLLFKSAHGPSKLEYDWFPGSPVNRFDNIVLRACFTDAWTTRYSPGDGGARYRPEDSIYLRDVWVKDSLAEMGHLSGRSSFVHLYLNGLYWGLYNPSERLDASFFAEHLGGHKDHWDVIRDFSEVLDGSKLEWDRMMALVNAGIQTEADYQALVELVDLENLTDYMLLHIFAEAEDWPHHNWYAARRRPTGSLPATKWIFLAWDQEIVLDQVVRRNRINVSHNDTPARIYSRLREYPEFRRLFGDRVQKHLFNDGALSPARNIARLQARVEQVQGAINGESARWGDARKFPIAPNSGTGQTFTRDEWWKPELEKLYTNLFQKLTSENLDRFRSAGLYPNLEAPQLSQFGGRIPDGFELEMTHGNSTGVIYYTLDGSDPRVNFSGNIALAAQVYTGPLTFMETALLRARVLNGDQWSALVKAVFRPPQDFSKLVVTEIMFHPPDGEGVDGNEFEFLELKNVGAHALDLSGLVFTEGIRFSFPEGMLLPSGAYLVLVRNPEQFQQRYPGAPVHGVYSGRLDNSGETLTLSHLELGPVLSVTYGVSAPWPSGAGGAGLSFHLVDEEGGYAPDNWVADWPTPGSGLGEQGARVKAITVGATGVMLEFLLEPNRSFRVLYSDSLISGEWKILAEFPAQTFERSETALDPGPLEQKRFYRLSSSEK